MKLKHLLRYCFAPALALILSSTAATLQAQNSLTVSAPTIFLNGLVAGSPVQQTFTISSSPATTVPFTITPRATASWLTVAPSTGGTFSTITLTANPAGLNPGVYSATLDITSPNATTTSLTVVFTVNNPATPLVPMPNVLTFDLTAGSAQPPAQTISIATGAASGPFVLTPLNAPWLLLGQSGNTLTVGLNLGGLTPGQVYVGGIQIAPQSGQPAVIVPVVFNYSQTPQLSVSPSAVTFNYQIGAANNIVQKTVTVTPPGTNFTATATPQTGGTQWLSVAPTSGSGSVTIWRAACGIAGRNLSRQGHLERDGRQPDRYQRYSQRQRAATARPEHQFSSVYVPGGWSNPATQTVTPTTTTTGLPYTVAAASPGNWLSVNVTNAVTPNPVTVSVNPVGLPAGTYTGTLSFNAVGAANNPQTVNVTLTVTNNPTLTSNPDKLVFNYEIGQAVPGNQTVSISSGGTPVTFTVAANGTSNGINWLLTGAAASNTTPATLTVGVNPAGLPAGSYTGSVQLTGAGGAPQLSIPVTLNVSTVALLNLPTSIAFNSVVSNQPGQQGPSQTITVTSTGEAVTYTVVGSTTTPSGSNWLVVGQPSGPASSTTPSSFIVGAIPAGLSAGSTRATWWYIHPTELRTSPFP